MSKKKVLLVEDDSDVRLGYSVLLKAHQYDSCFAADGAGAISQARPVIVVSARDLHANKDRALEAGAKVFVQKPWNDEELLAPIGELLGGGS